MHDLIVRLAFLAWTAPAWTLGGYWLTPVTLRKQEGLLVAASSFALGGGLTAILVTIALLLGRLRPPATLLIVLLWSLLAVFGTRALIKERGSTHVIIRMSQIAAVVILAATGVATLVTTLAPPTSMDASVYHLRIPREYLRGGRLVPLTDDVRLFQPVYVEMLFAFAMSIKDDVAAALTHWLWGVTASLTAGAWARRLGARWALLGVAIFAVNPLVVWESTSSFIDLGLASFTGLGLLWASRPDLGRPALVFATLFAGLAAGSKYTGCVSAVLIGATAAVAAWPNRKQALRCFLGVGTGAAVLSSPWYIRNAILSGNPFYPLANHLFGVPWKQFSGAEYGLGHDFFHFLTSPFDLIWRGNSFDSGWAIGPAYLAFVPIAFLSRTLFVLRARVALLIAIYWGFWFYSSPQGRLLLPILPIAAGLAAIGFEVAMTAGPWSRAAAWGTLAVSLCVGLGTSFITARISLPVVLGMESPAAFLRRFAWDYPAYEEVNRRLGSRSQLAVVGATNVYYLEPPARIVQDALPSVLRKDGFTHLLRIGTCAEEVPEATEVLLWKGRYPRRGSRFQGTEANSETCSWLFQLN